MTREEAIKYLNEFILFKKISNTTEREAAECFKLAVEALQQQPSENEEIIKVSKGALKARTGRYVIYDVEWLKEHFNTTEAKIYGQPEKRTEEHTEMHACDYISRQAVLEGLANIAKAKAKSDAQKSLIGRVMFFTEHLPSVTPQPKTEQETHVKKGHWIGHREHCERLGVMPSGLGVYEWCSNCDYGIDIRDWSRINHNYCPNCGSYNGGKK